MLVGKKKYHTIAVCRMQDWRLKAVCLRNKNVTISRYAL